MKKMMNSEHPTRNFPQTNKKCRGKIQKTKGNLSEKRKGLGWSSYKHNPEH